MRFYSEIVLFVSCSLLCYVPQADTDDTAYPKLIPLGEGGKYFSFVDKDGALSRTYDEAEAMCRDNRGEVWDINDGDQPPLRSGKKRADQAAAKSVLTSLRRVTEVEQNQLKDEVISRLNVVFGKRGDQSDECKWYLAGPYTGDFYAFTYYDKCPKTDTSADRSWFVCQVSGTSTTTEEGPPTEGPEPNITTTSSPATTTTATTTTTRSPRPVPEGPDPEIIEDINETINSRNDTAFIIQEVTDNIRKLEDPFRGLPEFQENLVKRIEVLVMDDPAKALDATEDLFSKTVPTLALRMEDSDDYISVLKFVSNITSRIAIFTEAGVTNITNRDSGDAVLYRLQHFKLDGNRNYSSQVRTSTINAEYEGEPGSGTMLTTHMEFKNEGLKRKIIDDSERVPEKFSSDLVEFFMRFTNGTAYNSTVDLFFDAETMQARRVSEHDCVFLNIETRVLDRTGCDFQGLTPDGKVHCQCNHTTTFGSVFLPNSLDREYEIALNIVGHTMDCFSLSALLLSILVFSLVRQIRNVLTVIHLNLCICLFVSEILIVAHSFAHLIDPEFKCFTALGMLMHYSFLTVIAWSTLEGIYILQLMIVVFKAPESHTRYYLLIGYLLPAVFPSIAVYFNGAYLTESGPLCFLDKEKTDLFWTFLGPLVVMLSVNIVAISAVIYRLCTINRSVRTVKSELLRYLRGIVCMSALLGLQWVLGIISVPVGMDKQGLKFAFVLLFLIFTLLQGPLIFVVHIMLVKDTRYAVARYLARRGRWSRCVANFIRPPPPATERHLHQGNSSTRTTDLASSNHSSSAPQTPLELNAVTTNPL